MSKAEEEANKRYSITRGDDTKETSGIDMQRAQDFIDGYHQAEQDLELTWEDIPKIFSISEQLKTSWWFRDNEQTKLIGTQVFWEEVLKRFKAQKGE